jgi:ubiquinone/menaquinone biosynthesis C-methylase UbiE
MNGSQENKNYITAEYLKKVAEEEQSIKKGYAFLDNQKDSYVLDVGCGPTIDTVPFSELTGAKGLVIGVDCDLQMVEKYSIT